MTKEERLYVLPGLTAGERKLLASLPRRATLAEEIEYIRGRIQILARTDDDKNNDVLLRMMSLLTRMVSIQAKLGQQGSDADFPDLSDIDVDALPAGECTPQPK